MPPRKLGVAPKGYKKLTQIYNDNQDLKYFREQCDIALLFQNIIDLLEEYGIISDSLPKSKFIHYKKFVEYENCDFFFKKALIKGKKFIYSKA